MSKRKTIDAFFKKKDVSNSEIRTPVAVETNVNTSMLDEHIVIFFDNSEIPATLWT